MGRKQKLLILLNKKQPLYLFGIKAVLKAYLLNISLSAFAGKNLTF